MRRDRVRHAENSDLLSGLHALIGARMPGLVALNWRFTHLPVFHADEARPGMRVDTGWPVWLPWSGYPGSVTLNTAFHSMGITRG
jgi:hypothetical protein